MPLTPEQAIARHIVTCSERQLPEQAIAIAKRSIVDGMAALVAGRRAEGIDEMLSLAERWGGAPEARIYGTGRRTSSPTAAWINGAQMRALELDDCTDTLPLHPTAALLPALLAAVDLSPMSGGDLVRALIIAQDLKIRFGLAITRRSEEHTSELQSQFHLVCRLLLEKKKTLVNFWGSSDSETYVALSLQ